MADDGKQPELFDPQSTAALRKKKANPPASTLQVTFNTFGSYIKLHWESASGRVAEMKITCSGQNELTWDLNEGGRHTVARTEVHRRWIWTQLEDFRERFPVAPRDLSTYRIIEDENNPNRQVKLPEKIVRGKLGWSYIAEEILTMGQELGGTSGPVGAPALVVPTLVRRELERVEQERQKRDELQERIRAAQQRQREREEQRQIERQARELAQVAKASTPPLEAKPAMVVPEVPVTVDLGSNCKTR